MSTAARKFRAPLVALLAIVAACEVNSTDPSGSEGPSFDIVDAAHGYPDTHFYFLSPVVTNPSFTGEFDGSLSPTVVICALRDWVCNSTIAVFTSDSGPGSETVKVSSGHYRVDWHTGRYDLDSVYYRITVFVEGIQLGSADVVVFDGNGPKDPLFLRSNVAFKMEARSRSDSASSGVRSSSSGAWEDRS